MLPTLNNDNRTVHMRVMKTMGMTANAVDYSLPSPAGPSSLSLNHDYCGHSPRPSSLS